MVGLVSRTDAAAPGVRELAYVANRIADTVSVIDTAAKAVVSEIRVGDGLRASTMEIHPSGTFAYAVSYLRRDIVVIDMDPVRVARRIPHPAGAVRFTPDGRFAYLRGHADGRPGLWVFDVATETVVKTLTMDEPRSMLLNPRRPLLYLWGPYQSSIAVVATDTHESAGGIALPRGLRDLVVSPDGARVYALIAANDHPAHYPVEDGMIAVIDDAANAVVRSIRIKGGIKHLRFAPNSQFAYATTKDDVLAVIDVGTDKVVHYTRLPAPTNDVALRPDSRLAYVATTAGIAVVDARRHAVIGTVPIEGGAAAVRFSADGRFAWATVAGGYLLIDVQRQHAVQHFPVRGPLMVAPHQNTAYVLDTDTGLWVIDAPSQSLRHVLVDAEPVGVVTSPDGTRVYVASRVGRVDVIDTAGSQITDSLLLPAGGAGRVVPVQLVLDAPGRVLLVAFHRHTDLGPARSSGIVAIDTATLAVTGIREFSMYDDGDYRGVISHVVLGPSGDLYALFSESGEIARLDLGTGMVEYVADVGSFDDRRPGFALSADGTSLYVTHWESPTDSDVVSLVVVDTRGGEPPRSIRLPGNAVGTVALSRDDTQAYVATRGWNNDEGPDISDLLSVVDTRTRAISATVALPRPGHVVALTPEGRTAYVTSTDSVLTVDLHALQADANIPVGHGPNSIAFASTALRVPTMTLATPTPTPTHGSEVPDRWEELPRPPAWPTPTPATSLPQGPSIALSDAHGVPGERVTISAVWTEDTFRYALLFELAFKPPLSVPPWIDGRPDCSADSRIENGRGFFEFLPAGCTPAVNCDRVRGLITTAPGDSPTHPLYTRIFNGPVFRCNVDVAPTAQPGQYAIDIREVLAIGFEKRPANTRGGHVLVAGDPLVSGLPTSTPVPTRSPGSQCQTSGLWSAAVCGLTVEARAGEVVDVGFSFHRGEFEVAGVQFDLAFDPPIAVAANPSGGPACALHAALRPRASAFAFLPPACTPGVNCRGVRALIFPLFLGSIEPIPDTPVLCTCKVAVSSAAAPGSYPLYIDNVSAGDGAGQPASAVGVPGAVVVSGDSHALPPQSAAGPPPGGGCALDSERSPPRAGAWPFFLLCCGLIGLRRCRSRRDGGG